MFLQNHGLEETTPQEASPEDAPTASLHTSPTAIYRKQKDNLQRLPPQPFEQPPIPTLGDSLSTETTIQKQSITEDSQVSDTTNTKSKLENLASLPRQHRTNSETEIPTPNLRSRRARPIRVKQHTDMVYY